MNKSDLTKLIITPHVSEKTTNVADKNRTIVFKVMKTADKKQIKQAVETIFEVKVSAVNTVNVKGKSKRFGQRLGRRKNWKKAYVTLLKGHDIDFMGQAG